MPRMAYHSSLHYVLVEKDVTQRRKTSYKLFVKQELCTSETRPIRYVQKKEKKGGLESNLVVRWNSNESNPTTSKKDRGM